MKENETTKTDGPGFGYVLFDDEYVTILAIRSILSALRPEWSLMGHCDHTGKIARMLDMHPNLIISKVVLADGSVADIFTSAGGLPPMVLYSEYPMQETIRGEIPSLVHYIQKPVSRGNLEHAILKMEGRLMGNKAMQGM